TPDHPRRAAPGAEHRHRQGHRAQPPPARPHRPLGRPGRPGPCRSLAAPGRRPRPGQHAKLTGPAGRSRPDHLPSRLISGVFMPANTHPFNPAAALAEHLADRVRAAADTLIAAAKTMTSPTPPPDGYTPVTIALRRLLDALTEQAITY